jgi:D-alanyl-lipoteichoic acid acyltransferase DltB (MBOAT superfamily)
MLFNSLSFAFFFPLVTLVYFLLPHAWRWAWLLLASCYFYMAFVPIYILILAGTIVVDYFAGIWIDKCVGKKRKAALVVSIVANVGVLAIFKYYNFINENIGALLNWTGHSNPIPYLTILLPIGLSFHTFQAMSYTIEVYRGNQAPERHFGRYSLYVMFYPQLVAGPIERPQNVLHQFLERKFWNNHMAAEGLKKMVWGFFKKMVVADNLARIVNFCFDSPNEHSGWMLLLAAVCFCFQIYCDFSGYSDIALGSAQVMGFHLMTNFNMPFNAGSISTFWSKWHISLSTWFRDYVYIPLGGNRVSIPRWYLNLFLVFMISGLWHGASWNFVIWGALHGIFLIVGAIRDRYQLHSLRLLPVKRDGMFARNFLRIQTFIQVAFAFIFFRALSLTNALTIIKKIATVSFLQIQFFKSELNAFGAVKALVIVMILAVFIFVELFVHEHLQGRKRLSPVQQTLLFGALLSSILVFGFFGETQFIYFQF